MGATWCHGVCCVACCTETSATHARRAAQRRRRRTTSSAEKRAHDASEAQRWLLLGACSSTSRDQEVGSLPLGRRLPRRGTPARARHRSSPHPHLCTHSAGAGTAREQAGPRRTHAPARPPASSQQPVRRGGSKEGRRTHARADECTGERARREQWAQAVVQSSAEKNATIHKSLKQALCTVPAYLSDEEVIRGARMHGRSTLGKGLRPRLDPESRRMRAGRR